MLEQFRKFLNERPVRAGYCIDCLSQLYGESVETIDAYLRETEVARHHGHCRHCGEHRDTFSALHPSL